MRGGDLAQGHGRAEDLLKLGLPQGRNAYFQDLESGIMKAFLMCMKCGIMGKRSHFGLIAEYNHSGPRRNLTLCWHCAKKEDFR